MENEDTKAYVEVKKPLVLGNQTFYPSSDFRLSENDHQKFLQEIKATKEMEVGCLKILKERLQGGKEIRYRIDDDFLLCYLRFQKLNCVKTENALQKLYRIRRKNPELFALPPNLETFLNTGFITYLPYKDEEGRLLVWIDYGKWKLEEMSFCNLMQMVYTFGDHMIMNPSCQTNGIVYIWDVGGLSAAHVKEFLSPRYFLVSANNVQGLTPIRVKRIIVLNCSKLFQIAWNILRPFLKKKVADRLIILGSDMAELHQYVNSAVLPKKYGGTLEERECDITQAVMENLPNVEHDRSFGFL